ncbi:N-succinylarginine dihydrolase [Candidatus Pantoea carbekii]|uniref:N-succinylarginine dihydrolase n=1 Tax=Candidatus Pantoea carbekii TaxID=1235990 RepID=UPI00061879EB|nr:N-succinylarginine dihydrolase [Candidatus Pantoea carbekii]AKC32605.1 succinylarginine dihydrolase astB [Candidatus Pantoea carbekii]
MSSIEVNFDGLVGQTHHYAGLSIGNHASLYNRNGLSNPKKAVLQGLKKMKILLNQGFVQGIVPPQPRPNVNALRALGFSGTNEQLLRYVGKTSPLLLSAFSSASSMWTANAATVSPSADSRDGKVHFTVANLNSKLHRSFEVLTTSSILRAIFNNRNYFCHHNALPQQSDFGDEGGANHNRLCKQYDTQGIQLFVYGRKAFGNGIVPQRYPARQTLEASEAVSRLHQLNPQYTIFVQQNPVAIDSGVFHNDVISVSNQYLLFHHQYAFLNQKSVLKQLFDKSALLELPFINIEVPESEVTMQDAITSYLFNSQILTKSDGKMLIVVPEECRRCKNVWRYLNNLIEHISCPINEIQVFNLRESMQNGGGPACLRLRVVLNKDEFSAVNSGCILTDYRYKQLIKWVEKHYRDRLHSNDLVDPQLLNEVYQALDELTQLLMLGSIYDFQQ